MTNEQTSARIAIRELIDRYHAAINHRDWTMLATLFAPDAIWQALAPIDLRFDGHGAVLAGLRASVLRQELLVQASSGLIIDLDDADTASVQSTLIEFGRESGTGTGWSAIAFYSDTVRRLGDDWRFARRTLRVRYMGELAVTGRVADAP
ncbi:nuclear transport factor 2 family protein [Sphingomonas sp.]|uniref:nuclear transport factor 2 family protein n=1 Tax=Sphingomonas sp. TaxID=28214 RepID=UPI003D6CE3DC